MAKQLIVHERSPIVIIYKQGYSTREIAKIIGTSQPTIVKTITKFKTYAVYYNLGNNGRPLKVNQIIFETIKKNYILLMEQLLILIIVTYFQANKGVF